jgi:signal transduction histidine kinase
VNIIKPLKIQGSNKYRYLVFEKELPFIEQFNRFSLEFLGLFLLAMVGFIVVFLLLTNRWINKPLKIIEETLELDDISKTKGLDKFGSEFVEIGSLISLYITQKKSLEELKNKAEESDRLKSSFMANMSHEIRTPLNGIVGFSELLCSSNTNDETTENYKKIIRKCSNNLMRLISDILDYSKLEAGQLVINKEEFSTESLFTELSNHYESKAETLIQKGIHLIFKKTGGEIVFKSDKQRIKQILTNLISNAIKFTEHGAIEVDFYTDGKNIVFTVMDTGIGISEEVQQVIFERFWQASQPKTKLYGGTGLGLALSKGLVELLDGKISVKSKLGYGSIFSIEIPLSKES